RANAVVEAPQRRPSAGLDQCGPLGEEERQEGEPLLALRAEAPQRPVRQAQLDLVQLGAVRGVGAAEVLAASARQLRGDLITAPLRSRAVADLPLPQPD